MPDLNLTGRHGLPVIHQGEAAECGLACLAMVTSYHGRKTDLPVLRRSYATSLKGATLKDLMGVAHRLKFNTRALRLELEELDQLKTPCVLHWDLNHFVVLKSVGKDRIVIHDPAVGKRRIPMAEVTGHFTGVALELVPAMDFVQKDERQRLGLSQFWRGASGLGRFLAQLLVLSVGLQVLSLLSPFYVQLVVDQAIVSADLQFLTLLGAGFLLLLVAQIVIGWIRSWVVIYMGNMLALQMGGNLLRHMLRLPNKYFASRHVGDVVSRFGSLGAIQELMTTGLIEAVIDGLLLITTLVVIWLYSPLLSAIVLGLLVVYAAMRLALYPRFRELSHENIVASAEASSNFMETIRSMATVKQFGLELDRLGKWQNHFVDVTNTEVRTARLSLTFGVVNDFLFGLGRIVIIYLAATLVLKGEFTVGMLMAFLSYQGQFLNAGAALVNKWMAYRLLSLHLERLADIVMEAPEEDEQPPQLFTDQQSLTLEAQGLEFRYAPSEPAIMSDLDLRVGAGDCVCIIGPSGCGKSTLLRMLQGLEAPTAGRVLVNGVDVRNYGLTNYRQLVASVTQDDQLLSGSILENITLFEEQPDLQRMAAAAKLACIDETIARLPMNYHSLIGDMGDVLSAGERQRVMLARALYRQPRILFLDEATCHLDPALEKRINANLAALNITRVIVTHRHSMLPHADRIVRLQDGQLRPVRLKRRAPAPAPDNPVPTLVVANA